MDNITENMTDNNITTPPPPQAIDASAVDGSYEGVNWLSRFVWTLAGFNLGFLLPSLFAFLVMPAILPDYAPRRAEGGNDSEPLAAQTEIAYVVVTSEATITPTPSPTYTPTEIPPTEVAWQDVTTDAPTEMPTNTPLPSRNAHPAYSDATSRPPYPMN